MKLLISPASPFVRKTRVVLREADLMAGVEEVEVSTTPLNSAAEVVAANPLGKIPALVRDDGPALYDSRSSRAISTIWRARASIPRPACGRC